MVDLERRSFEGTAGNMEEFEREVFIPSKKPQILTSLTRKLLICKENWLKYNTVMCPNLLLSQ